MSIDIERLIHSLKTAIACLFAYIFTHLLGLHSDPWIIITVIVVMCAQIYVGSVIQKGYLRFLGTLIGCLLATITLLSFGHSALTIMATIALAAFIFSFIATGTESLSYAGTLGAVTTIIILISPTPTPLIAGQRFLEISLGILIATLISQFVLPIHARTHLRRAQAQTLEELRRFYQATMIDRSIESSEDYQELEQNIIATLVRQQKLAKESKHELFGEKFNAEHMTLTLYCEREMLRATSFMYHAISDIDAEINSLKNVTAIDLFNKTIMASLETLHQAVKTKNTQNLHIHAVDITGLRQTVLAAVGDFSAEQAIYADGFLFSAEILNKALTKLAGLFGVNVL